MIEQQYYTRERRGIFRSAEGYDTIAKSSGLSDSFIKKYLHPFCFYHPPKSLEDADEVDISQFPQCLTCFFTENGELVLGNTTYIGADFTGLRNTFFSHNFVIPANEKKEYVESFQRCIFAKDFLSAYDIEEGKSIESVKELQYDNQQDSLASPKVLMEQLNITEEVYKKLLYSAFMSVSGKKKIYVILDVASKDISKYAKVVLKYIFAGLPYELRKNMGFMTYSREPEGRKYINITFVEAGSIRAGDSKVERDYVFDLSQNRMLNMNENINHGYLDFAWKNIMSENFIAEFYKFCEKVLWDMEQTKKWSIESYDQLSILYYIRKGDYSIYEKNREEILESVFIYLNSKNIKDKAELNHIFMDLCHKDKTDMMNKDHIPSHRAIKAYIKYYELGCKETNIPFLVLLSIKNGKKSTDSEYVFQIFKIASKNKDLFKELMNMIFKYEVEEVLENYLIYIFKNTKGIKELMKEISFWGTVSHEVISSSFFKRHTLNRIEEVINESDDKLMAGKELYEFFKGFHRLNEKADHKMLYTDYSESIIMEVNRLIYDSIDLHRLKREDIVKLEYLKLRESEEKGMILGDIQPFILASHFEEINNIKERIFDTHLKIYNSEIKSLIKRLFINDVNPDNYKKIILGFISGGTKNEIEYSYKELIDYIYAHSGKVGVRNFILWSFEDGVFKSSSNHLDYKSAIKSHFINNDKEAFHNKETKKSLYTNADIVLKTILKEIEYELYSPFKKFTKRNAKSIRLGMAGIFVVVLLVFGVSIGLKNINEKINVSTKKEEAAFIKVREAIKLDIDKLLEGKYDYSMICSIENLDEGGIVNPIRIDNRNGIHGDLPRHLYRNTLYINGNTCIKIGFTLIEKEVSDTKKYPEELKSLFIDMEQIVLERSGSIIR